MASLKKKSRKSAYASGAPPAPVTITGSTPLTINEMRHEYNGLLIVLAAILDQNNGRINVTHEDIKNVRRQIPRELQIIQGALGLTVQFAPVEEKEEVKSEPVVEQEKHFLESSVVQEAREFLARQKETNDSQRP